MLRSGFLLGVGGPAAVLTLLVLPSIRAGADQARTIVEVAAVGAKAPVMTPSFPGVLRPISYEISPIHDRPTMYATMPRATTSTPPTAAGPTTSQQEVPKLRKLTREGCEAPLSSLVGPEARRMVPGRCMT